MKNFLFLTLMTSLLIGCAAKETTKVVVLETMDAEDLALAGEQLVNPATFMLADKTFDMALAKDPENIRALFYKKFLARLMVLKGAVARARPFVTNYGDVKLFDKSIMEFPNSPMKTYFLTGQSDIRDAVDVQNLLVQYREATFEFYNFLKERQNLNLVLNINPFVFQREISKEMANSCVVTQSTLQGWTVVCDYRDVAQRKINEADIIALRQMVAYEYLYFTVYTTYSAEGAEDLINMANLTSEQINKILITKSRFGLLRGDQKLKSLRDLGFDFVYAWKTFGANQHNLCKISPPTNPYYGPYVKKPARPGYLFSDGLCVPVGTEAEKNLALLAQALSGVATVRLNQANGGASETRVNFASFIDQPIRDLKTHAPVSYNNCGNATALPDNTLNGLFPDNNASQFVLYTKCK